MHKHLFESKNEGDRQAWQIDEGFLSENFFFTPLILIPAFCVKMKLFDGVCDLCKVIQSISSR
jgi:hypothetical protein